MKNNQKFISLLKILSCKLTFGNYTKLFRTRIKSTKITEFKIQPKITN